jgi:hypothetical protein
MPGRSAARYRREPVRFAVVGQGHFTQSAILPAFASTKRCELAAIFSDDRTKLRALRREYDVEYALPYDQLDEFLESNKNFGKYIVHGHTPVQQPDIRPNRINIDTGAYATGNLTLLALQDDSMLAL